MSSLVASVVALAIASAALGRDDDEDSFEKSLGLQCSNSDFISSGSFFGSAPEKEGSRSAFTDPEDAILADLASVGVTKPVEISEVSPNRAGAGTFAVQSDDRIIAIYEVNGTGDTWAVSDFAICQGE
ncbi:MAG: hypothetical protein WD556_13375 [Actinomycetota bacterium]